MQTIYNYKINLFVNEVLISEVFTYAYNAIEAFENSAGEGVLFIPNNGEGYEVIVTNLDIGISMKFEVFFHV